MNYLATRRLSSIVLRAMPSVKVCLAIFDVHDHNSHRAALLFMRHVVLAGLRSEQSEYPCGASSSCKLMEVLGDLDASGQMPRTSIHEYHSSHTTPPPTIGHLLAKSVSRPFFEISVATGNIPVLTT